MLFENAVDLVKEDLEAVERALEKHFMSDVVMIPRISKYLAEGGGKRIRPLLLLTVAKLCGYDNGNRHINICCAVEFIHSATLLHDDVLDGANTRRGKLSANFKWGNEASVLVGDYLFAKSFQLIAGDNDSKILSTISEACRRLIEGEVLQLTQRESISTGEEEYYGMVRRKTAALIAVSCQVGAILGKVPGPMEMALFRFGEKIGTAFQLIDDLLDYVSDDERLGKPAHNDLMEGHITLPFIRLYASAEDREKEFLKAALSARDVSGEDAERVLALMEKYHVIEYIVDKAREFVQDAKKEIADLPPSVYLDSLIVIADDIADRRIQRYLKDALCDSPL